MRPVLPKPRSNVKIEPTSPLGKAIRETRIAKQIPQRVIGAAIAAKCGGDASNVRVSCFELTRKLPNDAELTVIAQVLGLSVASLRELREASHGHREAVGKMLYEGAITAGYKQRSLRREKEPAAKAKPVKPPPKLASVPALADLVEQIDQIAPMPQDKDQRKRWFQCVSVLSRMGAAS